MSDQPRRADTGTMRAAGAPLDATDHAQVSLRTVAAQVLAEYGTRVDLPPDFAASVARAVSIRARALLLEHGAAHYFAGRNYGAQPIDHEAPTRRVTPDGDPPKR